MRKKVLSFFLIILIALSSFVATFLIQSVFNVPSSVHIEAMGYKTTTKEVPASGTPKDYSPKDNVAFLAYRAANSNFSSVTTGGVTGKVAGIGQTQQVLNKRFVSGNLYLVETTTSGLVPFSTQKYFNKDKRLVLIRQANNPNKPELGYKETEPLALSFLGYEKTYGWLPNQLGAYTICDETILDISEPYLNSNGDYEITINLDPTHGIYYYMFEIRANAGVGAFPIFSSVNLTITFDCKWTLKQIHAVEKYKNQAPGMGIWADCVGDLTEVFEFENPKPINLSDLTFFQSYEQLKPSDDVAKIIKEATGFDYLIQAFTPYLTKPAYFDISLDIDGIKKEFNLYLDLANNIYGLIYNSNSIYFKDNTLFINIAGHKYSVNISDLNLSNLSELDLGIGLDVKTLVDTITENIINSKITINDNKINVNTSLKLFSYDIPLDFNYFKDGSNVILDNISLKKKFFNRGIDLLFKKSNVDFSSPVFSDYTVLTNNLNTYLPDFLSISSKFLKNKDLLPTIFKILENNSLVINSSYKTNTFDLSLNLTLLFSDNIYLEAQGKVGLYNNYVDFIITYDTYNLGITCFNQTLLYLNQNDLDFIILRLKEKNLNELTNLFSLSLKQVLSDLNNYLEVSSINSKPTLIYKDFSLELSSTTNFTKTIIDAKPLVNSKYLSYLLNVDFTFLINNCDAIFNSLKPILENKSLNLSIANNIFSLLFYLDFNDSLKAKLDLTLGNITLNIVYLDEVLTAKLNDTYFRLTKEEIINLLDLNLDFTSLVEKLLETSISNIRTTSISNLKTITLDLITTGLNISNLKFTFRQNDLIIYVFDLEIFIDNDSSTYNHLSGSYLGFNDLLPVKELVKDLLKHKTLFSDFLPLIKDILDTKTLSFLIDYHYKDLFINGVLYLDFKENIKLKSELEVKFEATKFKLSIYYLDNYFYLVLDKHLVKLSLAEIKDILGLEFKVTVLDVLDLVNRINQNGLVKNSTLSNNTLFLNLKLSNDYFSINQHLEVTYNQHNILISSENLAIKFNNLSSEFVLPNLELVTYSDFLPLKELISDLKQNKDLTDLFKDNILNILKSRRLNLDLNYINNDLKINAFIYLDFTADLRIKGEAHFDIKGHTLNLIFIYKHKTLYVDLGNVLVELNNYDLSKLFNTTINYLDLDILSVLDLISKLNSTNIFKTITSNLNTYSLTADLSKFLSFLPSDCTLSLTKLDDNHLTVSSLGDKLTISLSNDIRDVSYLVNHNKKTLGYSGVDALIKALNDIVSFSPNHTISLKFNGNIILKDNNFSLSANLTFNYDTFDAILNVVLIDNINNYTHYLNLVYKNKRFYASYKSDLKSNNHLSFEFTYDEIKHVIDKVKEFANIDLLGLVGLDSSFNLDHINLNDILKDIYVDQLGNITFKLGLNISNDLLSLDLDIAKNTEDKYEFILVKSFSFRDLSMSFKLDFELEHLAIESLNISYYKLEDTIPLIDALVNTAKLREWHIRGKFNIYGIGGLLNLDIPYDIYIKLPEDKTEPLVEATFTVPIVLAVNNDIPYKTGDLNGGYDRVLKLYHYKDKTILYRGEYLTAAWFRKARHERKLAVSNQQFENNAMDVLLRYGIGLSDSIMKQITSSVEDNKSKKIDYANVLKQLMFNQVLKRFDLTLNVGELAGDPKLKQSDISIFINDNAYVSHLAASLQIEPAALISLKLHTQDMQLIDIGKPFDFSSDFYNMMNNYPYALGEVWQGRNGSLSKYATLA